MNRIALALAALTLAVAAVSCGTSTSLVQHWSDTSYQGQPGQKMMIIALAKSERNQYTWEEAFSTALQREKVQPLAGSKFLPAGSMADESTLKQDIKESGANLVAVTRLVAVDKEQQYVPGSTYYTPAPGYYGMYGYYASSYGVVHEPGYMVENTIVKLETNVYDVATEKLVWSGLTETLNPETAQDAANSAVYTLVENMVATKVIRKK
jgi:hypothetical protein